MKTILLFCFVAAFAACGDNPAQSDKTLFDTTAKATSRDNINRDSAVAAAAKDSAKDSGKMKTQMPDSAKGGGGVPAGTIDSGMTNSGAHKKMHHARKK